MFQNKHEKNKYYDHNMITYEGVHVHIHMLYIHTYIHTSVRTYLVLKYLWYRCLIKMIWNASRILGKVTDEWQVGMTH